jgi:neutral amino acid transport system permease protein
VGGGLIPAAGGDETIAQATTDAVGEWRIPLPGPGTYRVTLDEGTLPEDVGLRDPERATLEIDVRPGQTRSVLFPLGEAVGIAARLIPRVAQASVNGLKFGLIIAMASIGLSLIFGTTGLVNFAHGELVTFGAIAAWFLNTSGFHWGPFDLLGPQEIVVAAALAVLLGALLGGTLDLGLFRPLRKRGTGAFQMLVIAIGLSLALRQAFLLWFGGESPRYRLALQQTRSFGPLEITPRDMWVMAVAILVLAAVGLMLMFTRIGKAMRAVADNQDLAESSGIDVQRIIMFVWILGAGLAALGGVFLGVVENVSYLMGFRLLLLMFAGVILGGLGTAFGALVGSLVVGIVTEMSTLWFSTELKFVWALFIMALVLLLRPQGILGVKERIG